jgi:predicted dehydrogenase
VKVALLGYGFAGKTIHAPLIRSVPGLELATVVSSNPGKVKADLPDVAVAGSPGEAFGDASVELVVIATPNDTHFALGRQALAAGKHVVIDKPFTVTVDEAVELIARSEAAGRLLSVFHNRRWDSDFLTVRQVIASGELGEVMHFESHYDRYRPQVQARWREGPGKGSGIWFDLGSHLVDQALVLFGVPETVYADLEMQRAGAKAVDYFHVVLRYGRRRVILHGSNLFADSSRRFEVHGTLGSYGKRGMDPQEAALRRGEAPGGPGWGVDAEDGTLHTAGGTRTAPTIPGDYREYYRRIVKAVREGGPNPVSPFEALATMAMLAAGCTSAEERREIAP